MIHHINNMADTGVRKIWVDVKRLDLSDSNFVQPSVVACVEIRDDYNGEEIVAILKETFNLTEEISLVLKLRNHRGSLIPISKNIPANSKSVPYCLEVVKMYQNVKPKQRTVKMNRYTDTMKQKILEIINRIEKLESTLPELNERRNQRVVMEMHDLERKLSFLNKRFNEADNINWKGMFKKNPLW